MLPFLLAGYVDVLENVLNIQHIFQQMHNIKKLLHVSASRYHLEGVAINTNQT